MTGQELGAAGSAGFLQFLEEAGRLLRLIADGMHHASADGIGLAFGLAGVLHQDGVESQTEAHLAEGRQHAAFLVERARRQQRR